MKRPALFLDRDGVINVDHGYVHRQENFQFIDGIFGLVLAANRLGYIVVVVTNQAGIGRGLYSESHFHELTTWMIDKFDEIGAFIDRVYHSPYHPKFGIGKYRKATNCRKPAPGMLLTARDELGINMAQSVIVGDCVTDIHAGAAAGVGTLIVYGETEINFSKSAYHKVKKLSEVEQYLTES